MREHGDGDNGNAAPEGPRGLQVPLQRGDMPAPMAAMAEALRANAEALQRLDATQRKMVEEMDKRDRSQQVVASTRALNETFRGLSEIQRGLLDAVVKGRTRGGWAGFVFTLVAAVAFAGTLGFLIADRYVRNDTIPRERYASAVTEAERLGGEIAVLEQRVRDEQERVRGLERRREGDGAAMAAAKAETAEAKRSIETLERELATKTAQLQEYLQMKAKADLADNLTLRNMALETENRRLQEKVGSLERERVGMLENLGTRLQELKGIDPDELAAVARKMKVLPEDAPPPPEGVEVLAGGRKRLLVDQLNRLFPDADESYQVIDVKALADGSRFQGVRLVRYVRGQIVGDVECEEMVLTRKDADTVEVKLLRGHLTHSARPGERIPLTEDGHYLYLTEVGLKDWLRHVGGRVDVGDKGLLTWNSPGS